MTIEYQPLRRCISYQTWWFSIAMLVFGGCMQEDFWLVIHPWFTVISTHPFSALGKCQFEHENTCFFLAKNPERLAAGSPTVIIYLEQTSLRTCMALASGLVTGHFEILKPIKPVVKVDCEPLPLRHQTWKIQEMVQIYLAVSESPLLHLWMCCVA